MSGGVLRALRLAIATRVEDIVGTHGAPGDGIGKWKSLPTLCALVYILKILISYPKSLLRLCKGLHRTGRP